MGVCIVAYELKMGVRGKLVDLLREVQYLGGLEEKIADHLIANGVTVQNHGYWETVVEVKDNTVCGNGIKIEYKRCSCCKNPPTFLENDFCGHCGAKLDLEQPPKGE